MMNCMNKTDKDMIIERLNRDNNLLKLEKISLIKKNSELEKEMKYLRKRNLTLETLEANLELQISKYKDKKMKPIYWSFCVGLKNALNEERDMIDDEEEYV